MADLVFFAKLHVITTTADAGNRAFSGIGRTANDTQNGCRTTFWTVRLFERTCVTLGCFSHTNTYTHSVRERHKDGFREPW